MTTQNLIRLPAALLLLGLPLATVAETVYIIDKLLVGVHEDKTLESPIVKVLPTGTALEVISREGELAQVKDAEGATGWMDASYLTEEQPAVAVLEMIESQNQQLAESLKTAEARIAELETKPQKGAAAGNGKANEQIEKLNKDLNDLRQSLTSERGKTEEFQRQLTEARNQAASGPAAGVDQDALDLLRHENELLKKALAEANDAAARNQEAPVDDSDETPLLPPLPESLTDGLKLFGAFMVSPAVLAILGLLLLAGSFGGGVFFMDYLQRRRHGGFRL